MAFNPFSWFRDNQKGVMIGLIGLSMVVFIFSFGPGDALTQWLRVGGRTSGEVVATLNGKKIHESDIGRISHDRKLASDFLFANVEKGQREVAKELAERLQEEAKKSADLKEAPAFAGLQSALGMYTSINQMLSNPNQRMQRQELQQTLQFYLQQMPTTMRRLEAGAAKEGLSAEQRNLYQQMVTLLGFQRYALSRTSREDPYFGGGTRTEDALDFRLWQLQADRLGIKLTDADVMREINAEAAGSKVLDPSKSFADQAAVAPFLRSTGGRDRSNGATPSELMDALREEFRVVMAQGAILGTEPGVRSYRSEMTTSATPSLATPDEFYDFFRDQRTSLRVELYPITAASFLPQIKGEPTESELRARFERGAKLEPMPYGREAGFKRPRRIKVEYVFASADDPHYKKLAAEQIAILQKLSDPKGRLSSVVISLLAPGITKVVPIALDPIGKEFADALAKDYPWFGDTRDGVKADSLEQQRTMVHDSSALSPTSVASLIAGSFGGPTVPGLAATRTLWYFQEVRRSVPFNVGLLLAQSDPQTLLGAAALAAQTMPESTPRALLEPQILAAKEKSLAEDDLKANLETMATQLRKLAKKPAEARAYIAKAVQEYKLAIHAMPADRSPQDLLEELKGKKDVLDLDALRKRIEADPSFRASAEPALQQTGAFIGILLQGNGVYQPLTVDGFSDTRKDYLFWRTEDHKAEERTFAQVRDEVAASWRLDQARALARQQAEKLEKEVNALKATAGDARRFLKEQKLTGFELDKVVQATPPEREVLAQRATQYRAYRVPDDKADKLPYPPSDLAKQLLKLTRPGEATVIVDVPAKSFYLALLVDRTEPSLADFKSVYVNSPGSDRMYTVLLDQRREEFRKGVMEQLRRDAGADLDKEGRFKLPDSLRKKEPGQFEE